jgi:hypothetical protein
MEKQSADHERAYNLVGRLEASNHQDKSWLLLSVPNSLVRGVFDAMHEPGIELPPSGEKGGLKAHISVMRPEEIERIGGVEKITERGHQFHYSLGSLRRVQPAGWAEMSDCWFLSVHSPELERLRRSYGLTPLPLRGDSALPFHLTIAVRRKKILGVNDLCKAALSGPVLAKLALYLADGVRDEFESLARVLDYEPGIATLLIDPMTKRAHVVGQASDETRDRISQAFSLIDQPTDGLWVKAAYSPTVRRTLEMANLVPGTYPGGLKNHATPLTGMLTGGLLTAGLGYGTGKLLEKLFPEKWETGAIPRTLAVLGGGIGATPGAIQSMSAAMRGKSLLSRTDGGKMPEPNREFGAKLASSSGLNEQIDLPFRVDGFNRTVMTDPRIVGAIDPQTLLASTALVTAASYLPGPVDNNWVTPGQITRMAIGMGAGYSAASLVGRGLGVLMGMPKSTQENLKNTGMWAGALQAIVPHAFPSY